MPLADTARATAMASLRLDADEPSPPIGRSPPSQRHQQHLVYRLRPHLHSLRGGRGGHRGSHPAPLSRPSRPSARVRSASHLEKLGSPCLHPMPPISEPAHIMSDVRAYIILTGREAATGRPPPARATRPMEGVQHSRRGRDRRGAEAQCPAAAHAACDVTGHSSPMACALPAGPPALCPLTLRRRRPATVSGDPVGPNSIACLRSMLSHALAKQKRPCRAEQGARPEQKGPHSRSQAGDASTA